MTPVNVAELRARKQEALASFERFLHGDGLPAWPLEVFIEVSNLCNLKCAMCGTFSAVNPRKYMLMSEVDRDFYRTEAHPGATDSVLRHALAVHAFGYGEPTMHPEFKELIGYLSSFGAFVDFFTNGMKLDAELCEFLVENRIGAVCVSISGATCSDYENLYIGGEFDTVLEGMRRLDAVKQAHGAYYPRIQVNSLGYEHHIAQLVEFVELMASVGANEIFVKRASPDIPLLNDHISIYRPWVEGHILARAKQRARELDIMLDTHVYESSAVTSEEEWSLVKEQLACLQRHSYHREWETHVDLSELKSFSKSIEVVPNKSRMVVPPSAMEVPDAEVAAHLQVRSPDAPVTPCMEPFKTMYIQQDGSVKPCCFAPRGVPPLGDIGRHSGEEVWRGAGFRTTQRAVLNGQYPWRVCGNCIEHNHAPKSHYLAILVGTYQHWFRSCFGQDFIDSTGMRRIAYAPENHTAVRLQGIAAATGSVPQLSTARLPRLATPALCNIDQVADTAIPSAPRVTVALVEDGQTISVGGWAVDGGAGSVGEAVEIAIDGVLYSTKYGHPRPDVVEVFGVDAYNPSGFWCKVPPEALRAGEHTLSVRVIAKGAQGYYAGPERLIVVERAILPPSLGHIALT